MAQPATTCASGGAAQPAASWPDFLQGDPGAARRPETRELAERFLSRRERAPRLLLGRNEHAAALLALAPVDAIIDDRAAPCIWNGRPVVKAEDAPAHAIIVNCSLAISPVDATRRLQQLGLRHLLSYGDLLASHPQRVPLPSFVADTRADLQAHGAQWQALFDRLADPASQQTLRDVLLFRLSADAHHLRDYAVRMSEQYFEDFLGLAHEVFVDAGGFDGDTTETFCQRDPGYRRVILFEPSAANMSGARRRLAGFANIEFIQQGLSDVAGSLAFDADAGSASAVAQAGASLIPVTTLDEAVPDEVSFVKMDLEGWEWRALMGAHGHLRRSAPKLAIAVYHRAADFRRIPQLVLQQRPDYGVYLRHYTQGWSETVMFFVPGHGGA